METSLFGTLPPELRNRIYHLLLPEPTTITVNLCCRLPQPSRPSSHRDILALAQTYRGIYAESMDLYCTSNSWTLILTPFYCSHAARVKSPPIRRACAADELNAWMETVGAHALRGIGTINFDIYGKLEFLDISPRAEAASAAKWLADLVKRLRTALDDNIPFEVQLQVPLHSVLHYSENAFKMVGLCSRSQDPASAYAQLQRHVEDEKVSHRERNAAAKPDQQLSVDALEARMAKKEAGATARVKMLLDMLQA